MPWAHFPQDADSQMARLRDAQADYWRDGEQVLGIFAADGEFLGGTGLHARTLNRRGLEIGYWVRTRRAGLGVATAVTRLLVAYGFAYLGLERIQCGYNEANERSRAVFDKCGFAREARLRFHEGTPTPAMRAAGARQAEHTVMGALFPDDVPRLSWYADVLARLEVRDWRGALVARP
jgi:RimJ/RimL family protein N-acetyltransferase